MTTREAYAAYKEEFPTKKVGISKFREFRPDWVLPTSDKDQEVCMCKYHENIELLTRKIRPFTDNCPLYADELVKLTVCSMDNDKCVDRECEECGVDKFQASFLLELQDELESNILFHQWEYDDGKIAKKEKTKTLASAVNDLAKQLIPFSRHVYNMWRQHAEMKNLKNSLRPGEIIIHEDLSENYSLKQQGEIMAAHWKTDMCTLFTVVVYYKADEELKHISYTLVSDELTHDKFAVIAYNKLLMKDLKEKLPFEIRHVHYWSDGCTGQFKNKYCFANMLYHEKDFNATMDWSFFETAHGKGAVDGIGGTVKRTVWLAVLRNKVVVQSAEEFVKVARDLCISINVIFVPAHTIKELTSECEERWKDCKQLPNTLKTHFLTPISTCTIATSFNTTFSPDAVLIKYNLLPTQDRPPSETSDDHDEEEQEQTDMELGSDHGIEELDEIELNVGQWYAVYFGDYDYWFVGILCEMNDNAVKMNFLQQGNIGKNAFTNDMDDIHIVDQSDVFHKLIEAPTPISASRLSKVTLNTQDFETVESIYKSRFMKNT